MVGVEQAPGVLHQALVALHRHVIAFDGAGQVEQVGDAAHQFGIADAAHEGVAGRTAGGELVAAERRLPHLHGVDAGGLVAFGMEQHHAPIVHEGVAVAEHRILQHALDGVVDKQRRAPTFALVENVENIFAIGRADGALELHAVHRRVERLVLAALQVIAAREDDAVVFGQLHAGLHDRIVAGDVAGERVVDQAPPHRFAVRQHLEQDQRPYPGEVELRVVQRLSAVFDRFAVDTLPALGVVLDLDGQIATGGFHEQAVEDVQVRMAAGDGHVPRGAGPLEIEWRRQCDVALATGVQVGQCAIAGQRPAEHAHVAAALADLEGGQQLVANHDQLQQARMFVIGVELAEVVHERRLGQEAALGVHRHHVVAVVGLHQPVQPEHVFDAGLGLEPDIDVVAKQQQVRPDLDDVAADAVVFAADAEAAGDLQPAVAELGQALPVEAIGNAAQAAALLGQAAAQHFIGAALGNGLVDAGGGFRRGRLGTVGGIGHRLPSGSRTTGRASRPGKAWRWRHGHRRGAGHATPRRRTGSGAQRVSTTVAVTLGTASTASSLIWRGADSRGPTPR